MPPVQWIHTTVMVYTHGPNSGYTQPVDSRRTQSVTKKTKQPRSESRQPTLLISAMRNSSTSSDNRPLHRCWEPPNALYVDGTRLLISVRQCLTSGFRELGMGRIDYGLLEHIFRARGTMYPAERSLGPILLAAGQGGTSQTQGRH